ncbi:hypothetical protein ACHAXS_000373 [Conticribra weissflogii]
MMRVLDTHAVEQSSLATSDVILTAAHCLGSFQKAVVGQHNLTIASQGEVIDVDSFKTILIHPRYSATKIKYDVGLVILSWEIEEDVETVKLNRKNAVPSPLNPVTALGWG